MHQVLKENATFISFLDALSYVLNVNCMCLNWLKFILCNYF